MLFNRELFNTQTPLYLPSQPWINECKKAAMHWVYPARCVHCNVELLQQEPILCGFCTEELKYTFYERFTFRSDLDEKFNPNRDENIAAFALFYFCVDNVSQSLLHALKYQHNQEIGYSLGVELAQKFIAHSNGIECLIPVPIHPKKKFKRGYNQSTCIAKGMKNVWGIPIDERSITRVKHTESQTKKDSATRLASVKDVFMVHSKHIQNYKHIGLVDDVITTGATLKAIVSCVRAIHPEVRITIFALGYTS